MKLAVGKMMVFKMVLTTLNFHITNRCNLRCKHCLYSSGEKYIYEMDFVDIEKLVEEFAVLTKNSGTVNLYGGEPLLRSDIFKIIEMISSRGLKIGITTNVNVPYSTLFELSKTCISRITLDIDGERLTHDWLRRNGHFEKSITAIKLFVDSGKFTAINSVIHKNNISEIEYILHLCKELKINSISFYMFTPLGRGNSIKDIIVGPEEWLLARDRVKEWSIKNNPAFGIIWERSYEQISLKDTLPTSLCEGYSDEVIDARSDGNVYFCGLLLSVDGGGLGNIRTEKLEDILKRRKTMRFKRDYGCIALALQEKLFSGESVDPRRSTDNVIPTCPYDWQILSGSIRDLKDKLVHTTTIVND